MTSKEWNRRLASLLAAVLVELMAVASEEPTPVMRRRRVCRVKK